MSDKIESIMHNFDFEYVHKAMVALNWEWGLNPHIPSIEELKETAISLLRYSLQSGTRCSTGGFEAMYYKEKDLLGLSFIIEEVDAQEKHFLR